MVRLLLRNTNKSLVKNTMARKKRKPKASNIILIYSILTVTIYTIVCLVGWFKYQVEPPTTLSTCVYGFFGTELGMTMIIKVFKIKKGVD